MTSIFFLSNHLDIILIILNSQIFSFYLHVFLNYSSSYFSFSYFSYFLLFPSLQFIFSNPSPSPSTSSFILHLVFKSESPVSKSPHCRAKADIRHSLRAWTRFFPSFKISDQTNHLFLLLSLSLLIRVVLELFIDGPLICLYGTADSSDSQSSDV